MPSVSFAPLIGEAVRKAIDILSPKLQELKQENAQLNQRVQKLENEILILRELVYKTKQQ